MLCTVDSCCCQIKNQFTQSRDLNIVFVNKNENHCGLMRQGVSRHDANISYDCACSRFETFQIIQNPDQLELCLHLCARFAFSIKIITCKNFKTDFLEHTESLNSCANPERDLNICLFAINVQCSCGGAAMKDNMLCCHWATAALHILCKGNVQIPCQVGSERGDIQIPHQTVNILWDIELADCGVNQTK